MMDGESLKNVIFLSAWVLNSIIFNCLFLASPSVAQLLEQAPACSRMLCKKTRDLRLLRVVEEFNVLSLHSYIVVVRCLTFPRENGSS